MNLTTLRRDPDFWDRYAPFYEAWAARGAYHKAILQELSGMAEPGWHILDIGAGTGVLTIPMAAMGCRVTALEPSGGMRAILQAKCDAQSMGSTELVACRWEDWTPAEPVPDLIIGCNSLHLTEGGIMGGMKKAFASGAGHIVLITEVNQGVVIDFKDIDRSQNSHEFLYIRNYRVDSSFPFDTMEEVRELETLLGRSIPIDWIEGRPCQTDMTDIAVVWWARRSSAS